MMKIAFLLIPLVYLAGNGYLYWRVLQMAGTLPVWVRCVISVLFWFVAFSLFMSIGLRDSGLPGAFLKAMHLMGSVWMVFLLYSVLLLIVFDVARAFIPSLGPALKYALPVTACLLVYGYVNYRNPKVEHVDIALDKPVDGITAVAISDVHLGHGTGVRALKRYVDLINGQNPDVVFIAGDLIDNSVEPLLNEPFAEALDGLKAPMGIYMVPGNHEFISGIEACEAFLAGTRVRLLRDDVESLPCDLQVIGRDDRSNPRRLSLEELLEKTDTSRPVLVLDHQPYGLAHADSLGIDMQVSGHTHRGQIWPLNWLADAIYEQSHGYRKWENAHIYVSSGLSLWGPPFRIGTRSDMVVLKILHEE